MQYNRRYRTVEEGEAPVHPQDFPRIARELGFNFSLRRGRVDWNKIDSINVDRLVQECDLKTLQENVLNVVNYNLDREYDVKILDQNFVKLFKLAQLSIDYLLYSEQHLFKCVELLYKENQELKNEQSLKENMQKNYQFKPKRQKMYGKHNPITTFVETAEYSQCLQCGKTFLSENYLSAHILRRHPSAIAPDQSAELHVLRAEISELNSRLRFAEQLKQANQNQQDDGNKLEGLQQCLQEEYRKEIIEIKNMFMSEMKKLKETKSDIDHLPLGINTDLLEQIRKQEQELNTFRAQFQNKTSPELVTLRGQLEAQEQFWKSRLNEAQSKHTKDIADMKAQLSELSKANETQAVLQDLVKQTKEHDKWLALQAEQISTISNQRSTVHKLNSSIPTGEICSPQENNLINLEDGSLIQSENTITPQEKKNTEGPLIGAVLKTVQQFIPEYTSETKAQIDISKNTQSLVAGFTDVEHLRQKNIYQGTKTKRPAAADNETVAREMSYSDSSVSDGERSNANKSKVHYFPTAHAKAGKKADTVGDASRNLDVVLSAPSNGDLSLSSEKHDLRIINNELHQRNPKSSTTSQHPELKAVPRNQELTRTLDTIYPKQKVNDISEQNATNISKGNNSIPKPIVGPKNEIHPNIKESRTSNTRDKSSDSSPSEDSESSESTLTEESAAQETSAELALHTVTSMELAVAKNPELLDAFKVDIVEQFENRLRELAIDPQWQGIPTANYNNVLATLQHHESITAKKFNSFFKIKQNLMSTIDSQLGVQKDVNNSDNRPKYRDFKNHKLFKEIPGISKDAPDARCRKNVEIKVPPRSSNIFPKRALAHQDRLTIADLSPIKDKSTTPTNNQVPSRKVTSMPCKDQDTHDKVRSNIQILADREKAASNSSAWRLGSSDGKIDSSLSEPSPLRRFSTPISKSQDFLDAASRVSSEISPRSALKGALSTGSLVTKKRVVFSDEEFKTIEKKMSDNSSWNSVQIPEKSHSGAGEPINQTDQDSYTDSDFDLSSNNEEDSQFNKSRTKEPIIKLSAQQSNKIAQISRSIETQLRDASGFKPVGGIEAMFHGSSFSTDEKTKSEEDSTRSKPIQLPRKADAAGNSKNLSALSDDWDLEDLDDLLSS